jgi:hypothetical protein
MPPVSGKGSNAFEEVYYNTTETVMFDEQWTNSEKEVSAYNLELKPGQIVRSYDLDKDHKYLIVGTRFGNVTVYQLGNNFVAKFDTSFPHSFRFMFDDGQSIGEQLVGMLVGTVEVMAMQKENIGRVLESIFSTDARQSGRGAISTSDS